MQEFDLATVQAPKKKGAPGDAKDEEQIVPLANERFMVPEVLFYPSDIGVNQMGIAETLVHAVRRPTPSIQVQGEGAGAAGLRRGGRGGPSPRGLSRC